MDNEQTGKGWLTKVKDSITFKVLVIGLLVLVLLIPAGMVRSLIREREHRQRGVVSEIGSKWGGAQTIGGPILILPFQAATRSRQQSEPVRYLHLLPDELVVTGEITPEIRYRGIYEAVVYSGDLNISGAFLLPDFAALGISERDVLWDRASVVVGITDMKGVKDNIRILLRDTSYDMEPGLPNHHLFSSGVATTLEPTRKVQTIPFELTLLLNGSQRLAFLPVGKRTAVELSSTWDSPSFDGMFLPTKRRVGEDGFSAAWSVLHLNRNYPQAWIDGAHSIGSTDFGVTLVIPAHAYQKTMRTAKYAVLFIALTFLALFVSEVLNRVRIHPFQYLLVGVALVLFYSLLLSIAEHLSFGKGYLLASFATVLLVTGYARSVLRSKRLALMVGALLVALYAYLYMLLQLEDYALLLGSLGLFVIVAVVMYLTRRINWYRPGA